MHHSTVCAYNNIGINHTYEKTLKGNVEMIEWWDYGLPGSWVLIF